jgi:hypothetical protein
MADEDAFDNDLGFEQGPPRKSLFEILVPCNWNDGTPVRTRHHREWDKRVRKIANGLTILTPGKGQWVHESDLYVDRMIPVRVFCTQSDMDKIANITIQHYEQEAVMFYPIADWALIYNATEAQKSKFRRKSNGIAKEVADAYNS